MICHCCLCMILFCLPMSINLSNVCILDKHRNRLALSTPKCIKYLLDALFQFNHSFFPHMFFLRLKQMFFFNRRDKVRTILKVGVRSLTLILKKLVLDFLLNPLDHHKLQKQVLIPKQINIKEPPIRVHLLTVLLGRKLGRTRTMLQRFQWAATYLQSRA